MADAAKIGAKHEAPQRLRRAGEPARFRPEMCFLEDNASGKRMILSGEPFSIGRASACSLVLPQPYISRRHAEITWEAGSFVLRDAGSRFGTFVNGEPVVRRLLAPGDRLQFGSRNAAALLFSDGSVEAPETGDMLTCVRAVSTSKTDLERLRWFLEAAHDLNTAGKVERVLRSLLQATMTLTGVERGYVFLADGAGALSPALGMDAAGELLVDSGTLSQTVIRMAAEGREQFLVTDTMSVREDAVPESVLAQKVRMVICIPLRQRSQGDVEGEQPRLIGLLYLDSRLTQGQFSEVDQDLLRTIAREAAALVHNAQLSVLEERAQQHQRELEIAAGIQRGLMALRMPELAFAEVEAWNMPCSAVGGDFFDVVATEKTLAVALVDVSGKGISAAILASTLQGMLHTQLEGGCALDEIAAMANRFLCTKDVGKYATMVLLRLHADGRMEFLNCGHVQPRLCARGVVTRLQEACLPVGLFASARYVTAECRLDPCAHVVLVSDGLTEAEDADGQEFGEERLDEAVACGEMEGVIARLRAFCAAHPAADDRTVVRVAARGPMRGA